MDPDRIPHGLGPRIRVWRDVVFGIDPRRLAHLSDAPLGSLRRSLWWVRKAFFSRERSNIPGFVVDLDEEGVRRTLGERYFEPGWEMSYSYQDETVNLRRVQYEASFPEGYLPEAPPDRLRWWQVHVRGFPYDAPVDGPAAGGRLELTAHLEPEPAEHPDAHVRKRYISVRYGTEVLEGLLDEAGVEYERVGPWDATFEGSALSIPVEDREGREE
ncbi:hypothetical protein ACFO0N_00845 [Halobium salinum]|uniref:Uncharacterized protein n=1 Tax=Halobium salinum TaxID=1364940 RepID=A0ABD5P6Z3_9EURY|nr:hypothetical protein [Halobium salinum]